jgi:hypothetical protein
VLLVFRFRVGHPITIAAPKKVADQLKEVPPIITHPRTAERIRLAFNDVTADFSRGMLLYTFYQV